MNFSVRANPEKVRYSLWRDGRVLKLPRNFLLGNDGLLNLTKVKQKDSGDYQIKAVNKEGATFLNFTVDILCKY